jgi:hypothetical protein
MATAPQALDQLAPDVEAVQAFLAGTVQDHIHVVVIPPEGQPLPYGRWFGTNAAEAAAWAAAENRKRFNTYFTVNIVRRNCDKKPKKTDMVAARFCHVDLDPPKDGGAFDRMGLTVDGKEMA